VGYQPKVGKLDEKPEVLPLNQINKIYILFILSIFHLVLIFHEAIVKIFPTLVVGNISISILLIILFGLYYSFSFLPKLKFKKFQSLIDHINNFDTSKSIKKFLLFAVPITIFGIILRIITIRLIPYKVEIADMLPLIQKAAEALLHGGNPYQTYYFPYPMPLTFWPGLWLIYVPSFLLNFDPRWIGLGLWIFISIMFILLPLKNAKMQKTSLVLILSSVNILFFQISFPLISFQAYGHTFGLWLWLMLMSMTLIYKKYVWSAFLFGLVLASRQTAIIYAPILVAFWGFQAGWGKAIKYLLTSGIVFGIIVLPFLIQSPQQFLIAPIQHYRALGEYAMSLGETGWTGNSIGFSYIIQKNLGANYLSAILGITTVLLSGASFLLARKITGLLVYLAFCVTVFSFFTPIPWMYEYFPPLLFLTMALISEE